MKNQWKSHIQREPMGLLRPLPFYEDLFRALTREQQARTTLGNLCGVVAGWGASNTGVGQTRNGIGL